ncbi:methyltransferase [Alisedimentitalea sp. MJ-SS2]|uniref:tRNA1(Val) (adenine(37)-N6)-methyltransferase n=1 Tax=Aliisedimentitalea sp. MJ-SS2 TaxID=3049795 RepID=UPI00291031C5|nr:methyltransferase [Alisedimentitalea sp. MJ-SS2]MDU8928743.1 methyltransferase [Alisedimentitalea sp. MJ-SS2]
MTDLTRDLFLGGALTLHQPKTGYRAGVDPVLLAAAVNASAGQTVLDLGCGAGAAALCLGQRIPGLTLTGLELQPDYAALARRNASENNILLEVLEGNLTQMPATLKQRQFNHVITNPPYFDRARGSRAPDTRREVALGGDTALETWIDQAAKRLAPSGYLHMIQRAERLPEVLTHVANRLGSIQLLPLIPRPGRDSQLVILRARKGGRAAFRLHDGLLMHDGAEHPGDRENYSETIGSVLRNGAGLPFPG